VPRSAGVSLVRAGFLAVSLPLDAYGFRLVLARERHGGATSAGPSFPCAQAGQVVFMSAARPGLSREQVRVRRALGAGYLLIGVLWIVLGDTQPGDHTPTTARRARPAVDGEWCYLVLGHQGLAAPR
jgi:hypothetical protein